MVATLLPSLDLPPQWQVSVAGAAATILAAVAMLSFRLRDPLGAIILPGVMVTFVLVNLILGPLLERVSAYHAPMPIAMPAVPSLLLLLVAVCCRCHSRDGRLKWLVRPASATAMAMGSVLLLAHFPADLTGLHHALIGQATITGSALIIGLGWALWLLGDSREAVTAPPEKSPGSDDLWLAVNQQGRITRASVTHMRILAHGRRPLIGQEFQQFFNRKTLSEADLGKLNRACSWARCGRAPVAMVITYCSGHHSPRLLDMLVRPKLRDGEIRGFYLRAKDLSSS